MNTPIDSSADEFEDPLSNYEQTKYESELERILAEDPVSGMQTQPCTMVDPSLPVHAAITVLSEANMSSVLVVDNGRLVGIFTERDVLDRVADSYEELKDAPVSDVMTSDPLVIYAGDPSSAALAAIVVAGYRHVPVLNGNDIVGVVSPERVFGFIDGRS